jgi:hypothetical protein
VENYVSTADQGTKDSWQFATSFERDNSMIATAAAALGKLPADVDALFALEKLYRTFGSGTVGREAVPG